MSHSANKPDHTGAAARTADHRTAFFAAMGICLALAMHGSCSAAESAATSQSAVGKSIYQGKYSFVRIEAAESGASGNHPAPLDAAWLRNALGALKGDRGNFSGKPLFNAPELDELAPPLANALGEADAGSEVVFAIAGVHGITGLFQSQSVTTGRAFIADNRLNILFGLAQVNFEDELRGNHTLKPFTPGSRTHALRSDTALIGEHWSDGAPGRGDWKVIAVGTQPTPVPPAPAEPKLRTPELNAVAPTTAPTSPIEQRLEILERLKQKGLVTEQEYQDKRRSILKEL